MNKYISNIQRLSWIVIALVIRPFVKIRKKQIFCYSYNFNKYSCNPRAITEYILQNSPDTYTIYWGFNSDIDTSELDTRIKVVRRYSIAFILALYSSEFVFNNSRNYIYESLFLKKKNQKYIQTWHGSFGLKRVEKDVEDQLGERYVEQAKLDSKMCDLMFSNSRMYTELIRSSFWYDGPILENCMPRNDIFYSPTKIKEAYDRVRKMMGFSSNSKIVLYAPTFRADKKLRYYSIDWEKIISSLQKNLGDEVEVLMRLHPNMVSIKGIEGLINYKHVHNVTSYPDITDFLLAADIMISDYTSAMFDFALLNKPCFVYAVDKDEYDRGFYIQMDRLPFPIAESEDALVSNIIKFDYSQYLADLTVFKHRYWGLEEDGNGCKRLYEWMESINR